MKDWRSMLNMRSIVFLVVGGLTLLFHVYLYRKLVHDTTLSARWRRIGLAACGGLWGAFIGARLLQVTIRSSWWSVPLFASTWLWIAFALYAALVLWSFGLLRALSAWVVRLWAKIEGDQPAAVLPERRLFLSRAIAGGAVALAGGLTPYGVWRAFEAPLVSEVSLKLPDLPRPLDGFTIVQISDLHISPLIGRRFLDEIVRRCNQLKPDLVAVTGDLVDGRVQLLGPTVVALRDLAARYGTYFVTGNHEYYSGEREWCAALERMRVSVLRNRHVRVGDAGASFDLIGVDDWGARLRRGPSSGYDLERAIQGRDPGRAAVLLAHQPANFEEAVAKGMGLQLSGHTHGGQFFPVTLLVPLRWPRYAGLYQHGAGKLYVSRGTGFWGPPLRVGSPPEIVKITLKA